VPEIADLHRRSRTRSLTQGEYESPIASSVSKSVLIACSLTSTCEVTLYPLMMSAADRSWSPQVRALSIPSAGLGVGNLHTTRAPRPLPVFRFSWICALSRPPDATAGYAVLPALLRSIYSFSATALLCSVSCELYRRVTVPSRAAMRIGLQASGTRSSSAKYLR